MNYEVQSRPAIIMIAESESQTALKLSHGFNRPDQDLTAWVVCVEHSFLRSPGQAPYGAKSACAKSVAYPAPPTVVPRPESLAAKAA